MKKIFLPLLVMLLSLTTMGQRKTYTSTSYRTALGVKVWDGGGITLKHFVNAGTALEGIGYFWKQGFRITGLLEIHGPISGSSNLKWYIGPGAHIGFYNTKYGDGTFFGVDGVLGLDFKCKTAPLNLSLDWQPSFEFGDNRGFAGSWGGLGIRYTF